MSKKYRVVKYEPSTNLGVTSTQSIDSGELMHHVHTPAKPLDICQKGFETRQEAKDFIINMNARYPHNNYKVKDYFI